MVDKQKNIKPRVLRVVAIVVAWVSVIIIGILLLMATSTSSSYWLSFNTSNSSHFVSNFALNGLLGIILVLLLLNLVKAHRKKAFFKHLSIGLWLGLCLYVVILVAGIIVNNSISANINNEDVYACSSAGEQYQNHGSAIVPIATNNGTGTGFAVGNNRTILTAYHVVKGAKKIYANYSSGEVKLTLVQKSQKDDLALLKIKKPTDDHFRLSSNYNVGDDVYVYGYPANALWAGPPSLSSGIISRVIDLASLRANDQDAPQGLELLQTDAAINPGNSGGPLIGRCGVIGVVTAVSDTSQIHEYIGAVSEQNIGYAVSSKTVSDRFDLKIER